MGETILKALGKLAMLVGVTVTAKVISDKIEKKLNDQPIPCRYVEMPKDKPVEKHYEVFRLNNTEFNVK